MPPRAITLTIVAFWMATTGWFFHRDLWPRLNLNSQPPFRVRLDEEARTPPLLASWALEYDGQVVGRATSQWDLFFNGEMVGDARMLVKAREDDSAYEVYTNYRIRDIRKLVAVNEQDLEASGRFESFLLLDASGELRESCHQFAAEFANPRVTIVMKECGQVKDGRYTPERKFEIRDVNGKPIPGYAMATKTAQKFIDDLFPSQPVDVRSLQSVFNPMQPWDRLYDLHEDRTWRTVFHNPFGSFKGFVAPVSEETILEGGVLSGTEDRRWDNREVACQIIEYRGEEIKGKIWVRKSDGLMLRQEVEIGKYRLTLERKSR